MSALLHPGTARAPDTRAFLGVERSVGGRRWVDRLDASAGREALAMAQAHDLPELVARVLAGRGVGAAEAPSFLDPTVRALMPDPSVLTDMEAAAARIADAIAAGDKIAIFGDYDVDGATSSALLARFLKAQGQAARIYIPDRLFEGYGPNPEAMRTLAGEGTRLLVTVDCGTTSHAAFAEAAALGLEIVVLDHHQAPAELPIAAALVNPNRQDDISGLGHLAAVGVTFMAVVAINRELRRRGWYAAGRPEPDLLAWLDLVALGTVCDVVPLTGLNRAFVVKGLLAIARGDNPGLAALRRMARLDGAPSCHHLGFLLGPRINAGGRIGDAALGARLLAGDDPAEGEAIAAELDRLNQERQAIEAVMLGEASAEAEAEIGTGTGPAALITHSRTWHPGVVGLIAARLKERFRRPAIAIAFGPDGLGTGSARSVPGVDIGRAVRRAVEEGILIKGGGHAMAAGVTLAAERIGDLRAFLETTLAASVEAAAAEDTLRIDAALTARGATVELIDLVGRAGPFGAGHPEPVFALPAHRVTYVETVGQNHLRAGLSTGDGATVKAMAFRAADTPLGAALLNARGGGTVHAAGALTVDEYRGRRTACLRILDLAPSG